MALRHHDKMTRIIKKKTERDKNNATMTKRPNENVITRVKLTVGLCA